MLPSYIYGAGLFNTHTYLPRPILSVYFKSSAKTSKTLHIFFSEVYSRLYAIYFVINEELLLNEECQQKKSGKTSKETLYNSQRGC